MMEPIIDLIWSVEEEITPDDQDMLMSNCGGCGGCTACTACSWDPPARFIWVCP